MSTFEELQGSSNSGISTGIAPGEDPLGGSIYSTNLYQMLFEDDEYDPGG